MSVSVGIDLGTSNSCIAAVVNGEPTVLTDPAGRRTQPSVVAFGYGGAVVVGPRARQQLAFAPENTVYSVKRLIGRRFQSPEIERLKLNVSWGVVEGPQGDARVRVQGKTHTAQEISAHVLRHMKKVAEEALKDTVDKAVITVPAYFNDQQRQATRDAASIAGLECLRVLNEPTAAALAYGFGRGKRQNIAIYDLGGGTFDISILRIEDDVFEVVSTAGDTFLGGDDFDTVMMDHLVDVLQTEHRVDIELDASARARLRDAAERAKIALSDSPVVDVRVPNVVRLRGQAVHLNTRLELPMLRRLAFPLLQRTAEVCRDALSQAGLAASQIDQVLLVGGMTRSPPVRDAVSQLFGRQPAGGMNPDEVVAIGASIQAYNLTNFDDAPSSVLLDVTPHTLGIRTVGGFVEPLIPRNTSVPTEASRVFHTAHDNQTSVRIQVFQGDSRQARDNDLLAEFVLDGIPPGPRGKVRIRVTFAIDADGIVQVSALDEASGRTQSVRIEASTRLTPTEIDAMVLDEISP